jgi:hypothetical protein
LGERLLRSALVEQQFAQLVEGTDEVRVARPVTLLLEGDGGGESFLGQRQMAGAGVGLAGLTIQ